MHQQNPRRAGERRAHVRYAHNLRTSCRLLGREGGAPWTTTVADVSAAGLALRTGREVRAGAVLVVAVEGIGGRFSRPLLVRVVHARAGEGGGWQVGCTFVKPLTDNDLQALLLAPAADRGGTA